MAQRKQKRKRIDNLVRARNALNGIWSQAHLRGRCWGLRSLPQNPFPGSNITMASEGEFITISLVPNGELVVHQFCRCIGGTKLGNEIIAKLKKAHLKIKGEY
jgi:hypothetical protein